MMFDAKELDIDPRDDPSSARDECTASLPLTGLGQVRQLLPWQN